MKRFLAAMLTLFILCGCAASELLCDVPVGSTHQSAKSDISELPVASKPPAVSEPAPELPSSSQPAPENEQSKPSEPSAVQLEFQKPPREYNVIARVYIDGGVNELPNGKGFALVYEAQMDDEFNRRFSNDGIFWGLYAQLFDTQGRFISTFDFGRHNLYSIPTPVSRLSYDDGVIYFESRHTLDNYEEPYEMDYCFSLAVSGAARERIMPSNRDDWYRMKGYYVIEDKDGVSFQIGSEYDEKERVDRTVLRLVGDEYGESRIVMDYIDPSLANGLYKLVYNGWEEQLYDPAESGYEPTESIYDVTLDIDIASSQVTAKNAKATFKLDFAKGVTDIRYQYTKDMLDKLIATSPDGKREVWAADVREHFESAAGCDYVVKNESGIYRLCPGNDVYNVIFVGNDRIMVNTFGSLEMYNAADGSLCEQQPQFDYGDIPMPHNDGGARGTEKVTVGIAFDGAHNVILVASRQNTFGNHVWIDQNGKEHYELPVTLTVLDRSGKYLCDIETGLKMPPYGKFVAYSVDISCSDGIATLTVDTENREDLSAQVAYLISGVLPPDEALSGTPLK